jgi:hypothetical protein
VKLAVIFNAHKLSGRLTRFFTGCYAYHVVWVDEEAGRMYDMHLIRRRRVWPYYSHGEVLLFDVPAVTRDYLERQLETDEQTYGWVDYLLFGLRPLYHLVGASTRNAGGVICSEMVNNDIWACGGETPFKPADEPPSPCDLFRWLKGL